MLKRLFTGIKNLFTAKKQPAKPKHGTPLRFEPKPKRAAHTGTRCTNRVRKHRRRKIAGKGAR